MEWAIELPKLIYYLICAINVGILANRRIIVQRFLGILSNLNLKHTSIIKLPCFILYYAINEVYSLLMLGVVSSGKRESIALFQWISDVCSSMGVDILVI